MASCVNGHFNEGDAKFCSVCGSPTSGAPGAPASGFRSTIKKAPSGPESRPFSPSAGYGAPGASAPSYTAPTYSTPGYAAPVYGGPAYVPGTSGSGDSRPSAKGLAIAGMVLGIVADVFFFAWFIGLICAIVGLTLSSIAWRRISTGAARPDGKGFAIAGFITSIIAVGVALLIFFAAVSVLSSGGY